ncbi:hypothetical protein F5146DRAFT_1120854 [Armillaria mellea]|nr:hypothetical protein F5146DRAFT_1120854 [Armillaria mellea]
MAGLGHAETFGLCLYAVSASVLGTVTEAEGDGTHGGHKYQDFDSVLSFLDLRFGFSPPRIVRSDKVIRKGSFKMIKLLGISPYSRFRSHKSVVSSSPDIDIVVLIFLAWTATLILFRQRP